MIDKKSYYKNYNCMIILYFSMVFILFKSFVKEKKLVIYEKLFDFLMIFVMFRKKNYLDND